MALIDKLSAIANAIRGKTGKTETLTLDQMVNEINNLEAEEPQMYILVDEDGNEVPAVLVDEVTVFDATANDIRLGKTAATASGVTEGTKEIPAYHTEQGWYLVKNGQSLEIPMFSDRCDYTKLQVIVCAYNAIVDASVVAKMVVIDNKLYEVGTDTVIAEVTVNTFTQSINLGLTNDTGTSLLIRYMTIKEEP